MISCNEIKAFKLLPTTITKLSKELNVSVGSSSKTTDKLIKNGLATKERKGKNVIITREKTIHAQKLEEIIKIFPRLPLEKILIYSNLSLIASLTFPLTAEELGSIIGVTRQWIHHNIKLLSKFGIIVRKEKGYMVNPLHNKLLEFAKCYCEFVNYQYVSTVASDALILWQNGKEFLFKTKENIMDVPSTAITEFYSYDLPLISDVKYYYSSKRTINQADIILHTILIDPQSKTYNAYACLLYEKTKPTDIMKKARLYNLKNHMLILHSYLKNHGDKEKFLLSWTEYETLAKQYGVR